MSPGEGQWLLSRPAFPVGRPQKTFAVLVRADDGVGRVGAGEGFGSALWASREARMAWSSSMMEQATPCLRRRCARVANRHSTALTRERPLRNGGLWRDQPGPVGPEGRAARGATGQRRLGQARLAEALLPAGVGSNRWPGASNTAHDRFTLATASPLARCRIGASHAHRDRAQHSSLRSVHSQRAFVQNRRTVLEPDGPCAAGTPRGSPISRRRKVATAHTARSIGARRSSSISAQRRQENPSAKRRHASRSRLSAASAAAPRSWSSAPTGAPSITSFGPITG